MTSKASNQHKFYLLSVIANQTIGSQCKCSFHVDSEGSGQTGWMPGLDWVFTGCTGCLVVFVKHSLMSFISYLSF